MRFKTNVKIFRGKIDLAPLVDIMFLLVIFFLISTSYDFQKGFEVKLPEYQAPLVRGDKLVVVMAFRGEESGDAEPMIFFNNEEVSWQDLEVKLAERINERSIPSVNDDGKKKRRPTISLKVHKKIDSGYVWRIFSLANKLKVKVNVVMNSPDN